jgi:molecular chaperone GrpE
MTDRKIPITDRRLSGAAGPGGDMPRGSASGSDAEASDSSASHPESRTPSSPPSAEEATERDYLGDLQRLQAEFDNYRKRMMKEQTALTGRATAQFISRLLPVLDNFERAIAHGEGGEGVALVFKSLKGTLHAAGLLEIPAEGVPFDPTVHEAVQSHEADVEQPVVESLFRRGYKMGDVVIRPAMVVVARPREAVAEAEADDGSA